MAARTGKGTRDIDIRALQRHLVEIGNLPEEVLTHQDSYPLAEARIAAAVESARDDYKGAAVILAQPDKALPHLREAYRNAATEKHKLIYAHILAVLGDPLGIETLIAAVKAAPGLDKGWRYTGMGQYGFSMSPLDRLICALGHTRNRRAVGPILEKLQLLEAESEFPHFRALCLALESIGDPAAAAPLARVLATPGIQGHASTTLESAIERAKKWRSWTATEPRSNAIRELMLGRALFRCGDKDGLGRKILEAYTKDLRGHLARHAHGVLRGPER
jgi:hypothetical protein